MPDLGKLVSGFRVFKATTFNEQKDLITHLMQQGQKPTTMVISCVDIRIPPAMIFSTTPGELYVINNIGGLVPPYQTTGVHGILSAIEYAVTGLEVENIIVLGHTKCSSIKMMMSDAYVDDVHGLSESMKTWLSIAKEARDAVKAEMSTNTQEEQESACEHESIIVSLRNLMTYPYIMERMDQDKLNIYACQFDIENGEVQLFNPDNGYFEPVS
jgi:carbonic anhydrase